MKPIRTESQTNCVVVLEMEHDLYCRDSKCRLVGVLSDNEIDYPIDNPCTPESLEKGVMRHRHPYDSTKFLQVCIYRRLSSVSFRSDRCDNLCAGVCAWGGWGERAILHPSERRVCRLIHNLVRVNTHTHTHTHTYTHKHTK